MMAAHQRSLDPRILNDRDSLLVLEGYCRGDCPAREVRVRIKDHDRQLLDLVGRHGLTCPVCRGPLVLHWVRTFAEQEAATAWEARCSVNVQLYERDHADGCVPAEVFCDDRLPE